MRKTLLLLFLVVIFFKSAAQQSMEKSQKTFEREVSGVVIDQDGKQVGGATVLLTSEADTMNTSTDESGTFVFYKVKKANFYISVTGIGSASITSRYLNNEFTKKIVLDPINLKAKINMLSEVKVSGTPTIRYKVDTVEYRARDYVVRQNANVDELLRKMEGMEVGTDGSLTYQGQPIQKAKLNGKEFAGGNVAQAIQNLPADIIEKAQIVNDYGDLAGRSGVKNGPMEKILNLTTKADRSVGNYSDVSTQAGNHGRYSIKSSFIHLNANAQVSVLGKFENSVSGIANNIYGAKSGLPGTTRSSAPTVSYRDQWNEKLQVLGNYSVNFFNNESFNKSFGQIYSSGENDTVKNTSNFTRENSSKRRGYAHSAAFQVDYDLDKRNFIQFKPGLTFRHSVANDSGTSDVINNFITGFEHPVIKSISANTEDATDLSLSVAYQHVFEKPQRNFSIDMTMGITNTKLKGDLETDYRYFSDSSQNKLIRDSSAHLLTNRRAKNSKINSAISYSEPIGKFSRLDFTGNINYESYNTNATADTTFTDPFTNKPVILHLNRLDNIFDYSFTESRLGVSYTYTGKKLLITLGLNGVSTFLQGEKINNNNGETSATPLKTNFLLLPSLNFSYSWSTTEQLTVNYRAQNSAPDFLQMQPFVDRSDPTNIVIGNPELKPMLTTRINAAYNKYFPNSKFTFGLNLSVIDYKNQAVTNTLQIPEVISAVPLEYRTVYETHFLNMNGSKSILGNYNISKQLNDRKVFLTLNGTITYNQEKALSNNIPYLSKSWRINERLGPSFSLGTQTYINPYIAYDVFKTSATLPGATSNSLTTKSLIIDSRILIAQSWNVTFSASKNFVSGLQGYGANPLVLNAGMEKAFLQRRNLVLTFNAYDILHQNNFIYQTVTARGVTNSLTNTQSRHFLVGLKFNFQKWNGTPKRGGKDLKRKGDGSFIYQK